MNEHDHYLCKKEVAKLLMRDKGISFDEAFALVPDEAITTRNSQEVYSELFRQELNAATDPKKA